MICTETCLREVHKTLKVMEEFSREKNQAKCEVEVGGADQADHTLIPLEV